MIDYLILLRPRQWLKNVFIFAGLIFSRHFLDPGSIVDSALAFIIFSLLSSGGYIFNDIIDRKDDIAHPSKSKRPIAAGTIRPARAAVIAAVLIVCSLVAAFLLERSFFHVCVVYAVCMVLYSTAIKHIVLLDVMFVAFGYVLRAIAGAFVIGVEISSWLLICTLLIALFLAVAKRRTELLILGGNAAGHRRILADYSLPLLDQMIAIVTASCIVAYCLYTLAPETVAKFGTKNLVFTVPFVIYGLFRYLYITYQERHAGSPERVLFRDLPLQACLLGWILACVLILITA
ncbi:decaprenyl-phosphate phosphoribosyltransferase [candidate division WOR-3 bacterium]|nr:decaprenyl-phosphate phosphoribosyltransferase [candidate division WOR-3 bacterium]